jgi:hypothetical protein
VARKITNSLNALLAGAGSGSSDAGTLALAGQLSRFECLPHTEGCGTGYPDGGIDLYSRIMLGHLMHPSIATALCLEHGCEKTHNDFFSTAMTDAGLDPAAVGYASIQLDGGIEAVTAKVIEWFKAAALAAPPASRPRPSLSERSASDVRSLDLGLLILNDKAAAACPEIALVAAQLARALSAGGGTLVLPASSPLLRSVLFTEELQLPAPADSDSPSPLEPTLAFGQSVRSGCGSSAAPVPGSGAVHIMDMPSVRDFNETVTGLAATGCHAVLVLSVPPRKGTARPAPGHPLMPVVHIGLQPAPEAPDAAYVAACDAVLCREAEGASSAATAEAWASGILRTLSSVASGAKKTKGSSTVFFSITRGPTGVST